MPPNDYIPITKEEKIIAYADNLVFGGEIRDEEAVVSRYREELGEKVAKKVEKFHAKISRMMRKK